MAGEDLDMTYTELPVAIDPALDAARKKYDELKTKLDFSAVSSSDKDVILFILAKLNGLIPKDMPYLKPK